VVGRGSVFSCTGSQHGGHETTLVSFHTTLPHHGMIVIGLPLAEQRLMNMVEITGGTPYGATTLAGIDGSRQPGENEFAIARFQGRHVAQVTSALIAGRKNN
jgi:NAD(P)H:quinone oxidoreductase type IV